ncbi:hypothetical protein ABH975_002722 [Bradyrhizobium ottawaense]
MEIQPSARDAVDLLGKHGLDEAWKGRLIPIALRF